MEPLHQFVIDLEEFLKTNGYQLQGTNDGDIVLAKADGSWIGFWGNQVPDTEFREFTR